MNKLLRFSLATLLLAGTATAQVSQPAGRHSGRPLPISERTTILGHQNSAPSAKGSNTLAVDVPGASRIDLSNRFPFQTSDRGLHTIQVDPSDPQRVHAVMMADINTPETDTIGTNYFVNRRVYYTYSSDGGINWSTPRSLTTTRSGYPSMILIPRGTGYIPVVALHRRDADDDIYNTSIYVERGAPGAGDWLIADADRAISTGDEGDIIWPAISASPSGDKIYVVASVIQEPATTGPIYPIQFSTFSLSGVEGNQTATWNGPWKQGPGNPESSMKTGGGYAIATSPSGKVGILWSTDDEAVPGIFYSESVDGGGTWSAADFPIYEPDGVVRQSQTDLGRFIVSGSLDLFYSGETANGIWTGNASTEPNRFFVMYGGVMYWKQGSDPKLLVSADLLELESYGPAEWPLDYLGVGDASTTDPTYASTIDYATIAQTQNTNRWGVLFQAWRRGDTSVVYSYDSRGAQTDESFVYRSLLYMTTVDGGATWSEPALFKGNPSIDEDVPSEGRLDYRNVAVSTWNPVVDGKTSWQTMYNVDTMAGQWANDGGRPTWSDQYYFAEDLTVLEHVAKSVEHTSSTLSLEQNYPNPFTPSTTIEFSLTEASNVSLTIEDMLGRKIATVFEGVQGAGSHKAEFTAADLSAGVYQYVLRTNDESVARRMVVTK